MQREVAERIGSSRTALIRWATEAGVSLDAHSYKPEVVRRVCAYYERHGKPKTQERFPEVNVRSIIERNYGLFKPRQVRWTNEQIIEAAKMAGLVSYRAQAKYFNRPRAFEGSVKSLWVKRFGMGEASVNGLVKSYAKTLIRGGHSKYIRPIGNSRFGEPTEFRSIILWVDLEKILKAEVPEFIVSAIHTMANFQRWLWRSKNPKPLILKMIKERELYA